MGEQKEVKISMIASASSALKYQSKKPNADIEEVMKFVMKDIKSKGDKKIAGIAAANHVLKYKQRKPRATEKEIMQDLANNTKNLLTSIQDESNPNSIEEIDVK